jgi:glutaconyl-CoA/methylmalonyl-CoA decarboxylase subunit gamma
MRRYKLAVGEQQFVLDVKQLGADRFEVAVGDRSFEVTLTGDEDMPRATITPGMSPTNGSPPGAGMQAVSSARVAAAPAAAPVDRRAVSRASGAGAVNAPMPGLILEVHVKVGDVVERGQHLVVLDAMKMHNFVCAPTAGTISEVCVSPGQAVGHGDTIVRFANG